MKQMFHLFAKVNKKKRLLKLSKILKKKKLTEKAKEFNWSFSIND